MEWFWMTVLRFPDAVRFLGHAAMTTAFALGMIGWRAHKILGLLDRRLARAGMERPQSLAEIYPTLPTWWIPESVVGNTFVWFLFVVGALMAWAGKRALKMLR